MVLAGIAIPLHLLLYLNKSKSQPLSKGGHENQKVGGKGAIDENSFLLWDIHNTSRAPYSCLFLGHDAASRA